MARTLRFADLAAAVLFCSSGQALATDARVGGDTQKQPQGSEKVTPQARAIAASDKRAIIEAFQGVDPEKYGLQFDDGRETYGKAGVTMLDLEQVRKVSTPGSDKGWIVFIAERGDVIFALAVSGNNLESVVGNQKAAQLRPGLPFSRRDCRLVVSLLLNRPNGRFDDLPGRQHEAPAQRAGAVAAAPGRTGCGQIGCPPIS